MDGRDCTAPVCSSWLQARHTYAYALAFAFACELVTARSLARRGAGMGERRAGGSELRACCLKLERGWEVVEGKALGVWQLWRLWWMGWDGMGSDGMDRRSLRAAGNVRPGGECAELVDR